MNTQKIKTILDKIEYNKETIELMQSNVENGYMIAASQEIISLTTAENAKLKDELAEMGIIIV